MKIIKDSFSFIKLISLDVFILYKNIFHWNLSKILIYIYSFILGLISSLPFVIILLIYLYFSDINWTILVNELLTGNIGMETLSIIYENVFSFIFGIFIILLIVSFYILGFYYSRVFLNIMSLKYLEGKRFKYFKKSYFNLKKLLKYFQISFWNILYLSIPIFIFIVLMGILILFVGGREEIISILTNLSSLNYFTVISFILFTFSSIGFMYILYRIYFSYIIFIDNSTDEKAYFYVKKSFKITKGYKKLFKFSLIILILFILILPFEKTSKYFENKKIDIINYFNYTNYSEEEKENLNLNPDEIYYYQELLLEYSGKDKEILIYNVKKYNILIILFKIFNFIVIYGLIEMALVSFYKRELLK